MSFPYGKTAHIELWVFFFNRHRKVMSSGHNSCPTINSGLAVTDKQQL